MPKVQYGNTTIDYTFQSKEGLKSHYISVEKEVGVILKGSPISIEQEQAFILKKARWILDKLTLVKAINQQDIVTGSRVQYLGRNYYVQIFITKEEQTRIVFNESKFKVYIPENQHHQETIKQAFEGFFRAKAIQKITPRIKKWSKETGLSFNEIKFRKLEKRWGSCTPSNNILINIEAIKLPFSLIDYLIVHELVHTKIKNHSKEFWAELSKYLPNWRELDGKIGEMRV